MRQLLSDRAPMRISQDRAGFEACVLQYGVQIGRERRHVVRPGQVAAFPVAAKIELERRWRRTASRQNNRPRERHGDNMTGTAQRETPQVAIFWLVQATEGEARLLAAGCPLDQAEPYRNCLTYGPGHYETWAHWRRDRTVGARPACPCAVLRIRRLAARTHRLRPLA